MTDNEIIKALEYCSETNGCICCEYVPTEYGKGTVGCATELMKSALDLIQRQQAEIEDAEERVGIWVDQYSKLRAKVNTVGPEVIKEFAEKLKEKRGSRGEIWDSDIDNLVKEIGCGE